MDLDAIVDWVPGGRLTFLAIGLLSIPGVRNQLRPLAKSALRAGMAVNGQIMGWTAEAREQAYDMVAELKDEREAERERLDAETDLPRPRRRAHPAGVEE